MPIESPSTVHRPPSTSFAPALFVFEKRPRWSTELKRHLAGHRLFVRTHTSASELPPALTRFPSSLVVLDMTTTDPAACLGVLGQTWELNLRASFIAIASPSLTELEWPLREFGVTSIVPNTIRGEELVRTCLRKLEHSAPAPIPLTSDL